MQQLLTKIEENVNMIENFRKNIHFSINDTDAIVSEFSINVN